MSYFIHKTNPNGTIEILANISEPWIRQYRLVQPNGAALDDSSGGDVVVPPLGGGGFGVVVRAKDGLGLDRALKIIDPGYIPRVAETTDLFRQEIALTTGHPLKHTIPVLDFGSESDLRKEEFLFYVMPFIPGRTLEQFFKELLALNRAELNEAPLARALARDILLSIFDQTLTALVELSEFSIVHMDISATNIMVYRGDTPPTNLKQLVRTARAFVIDLGAAKQVTEDRKGYTIFIRHRYYFPQEIEVDLDITQVPGRTGDQIRYERLRKYSKLIDLYCLARVLELVILDRSERSTRHFRGNAGEEKEKADLWRLILGDDYDFLEVLTNRLLQVTAPVYREASEVKEVFETLRLSTASAVYDSVLLTDKHSSLKIRAGRPLVKIAPPLDDVVTHPVFQRLKRLNQLTFINEIHTGATHDRFTHSLQTFDLTKRFLFALSKSTDFRLTVSRRDVDEILAAALLHDVGQYPFSHSMEDLRKLGDDCAQRLQLPTTTASSEKARAPGGDPQIERLRAVRHDQEMAERYVNRIDRLHGRNTSIAAILEDNGINVENVLYLFQKTEKKDSKSPGLNLGRDLVAGVVDADRLSYLVYDSEQTGVPYGLSIDTGSLIEGLTVRLDGAGRAALAIEEVAVGAAEAVVAALYWMYRNVYWHHTNRAFMASIKRVMRRLAETDTMPFEAYAERVYGQTDWEALKLLELEYSTLIARGFGDDTVNPLTDLVRGRRIGYKRVFSLGLERADSGMALEQEQQDRNVLYKRLVTGIDPRREDEVLAALSAESLFGVKASDGEILLDVPLKPRLRWARASASSHTGTSAEIGERKNPLWVRLRRVSDKRTTGWQTLQEYSHLARDLANIEDVSGRRIRVFFARSLFQRLSRSVQNQIGDAVGKALMSATASWEPEED